MIGTYLSQQPDLAGHVRHLMDDFRNQLPNGETHQWVRLGSRERE